MKIVGFVAPLALAFGLIGSPGLAQDAADPDAEDAAAAEQAEDDDVAQDADAAEQAEDDDVAEDADAASGDGDVPQYRVDPAWPTLPDGEIIGQVAGIAVDGRDHIWIIQRPGSLTEDEAGASLDPPRSICCLPMDPVIEFDRDGNIVQSWGGPGEGYEWPESEHGIFVDHNDNVWIAGNAENDHQVLKFSRDGTFLMQIGRAGETGGSNDTELLGRPADIEVDPETNEAYIADGYQNRRVVVFDGESGEYLRHWGAYGEQPEDGELEAYTPEGEPDRTFRNPVHCVRIADDGMVYVCDRVNNRIQVFEKDGTYVTEFLFNRETLGNGSIWDLDLSPDEAQTWLFNADGENNQVQTIDREAGEIVSTFGRSGRYAGQFHWVHNLVADSDGNIFTAEVDSGKRVQKFERVSD